MEKEISSVAELEQRTFVIHARVRLLISSLFFITSLDFALFCVRFVSVCRLVFYQVTSGSRYLRVTSLRADS